ncbi:hypothetical protein MKW98_029756 [Papaver atlanticum]|uniref:Uncharacterized protein n=1 Tax=Papaver atlanticum TaxID=357466 RepID=A0AAD4T4I6_9MAGN|nr:hypothetical protein MKW98_029756 [Papaver atlanticum]
MERGDGKAVVVAGKTVCVTGGAGYFASWLIMKLLQRGYSVRTTVRSDPSDTAQYKMLGLKPTNAVHIDDAASAQIFLFECQKAEGRHLCSSFDLPTDLLKAFEEKKPVHLSSEKLLSLGFKFKYGFEETYGDAIENCREKGFL